LKYKQNKILLTLLLSLISVTANAGSFFIDCKTSPKEAKLELPAPANEWAKIGCSKFGHILMAQKGWFWGLSPSPKPAFLPADILNTRKMRNVGNTIYFKQFEIKKLTGKVASERHYLFHKWLGKERTSIYPEVWEIKATNESNKTLTLNIFKKTTGGGWGIACLPKCGKMKPFIIVKR